MVGQDDERIERVLLSTLEAGSRDIPGLLRELRRRLGTAFRRAEGVLHPALHRALRAGRIELAGVAATGLPLYRVAESGNGALERPEFSDPGTVLPAHAKVALRLAGTLRSPADRGRLQADVIAHLTDLATADAEQAGQFGSTRSIANLLRRVDRGKPTVVAAWSASTFFKRVLIHDGPWILGVIAVFFLVRGLVVEVFYIPSRSMVPALEKGDRVVVWKRFGEPERFQIMTFDINGTTYVKRLIGLGGEEIALWNGDVFINRERLVKPDDVRAAMRRKLATWDFRVDAGGTGPGPDWRRSVSGDRVQWIWNTSPLFPDGKAHDDDNYGFRLRDGYLRVSGDAGSGTLTASLTREAFGGTGGGEQGRVSLQAGPRGVFLSMGGRFEDGREIEPIFSEHDPGARSGPQTLELAYVDGVIHARVGDWSVRKPYDLPDFPLTFEVGTDKSTGSGIALVAVDADQHYSQDADGAVIAVPPPGHTKVENFGHRIPPDHVFFLGDNTTDSRDSRTSSMGDIPVEDLTGPVVFRIMPLGRIGRVR